MILQISRQPPCIVARKDGLGLESRKGGQGAVFVLGKGLGREKKKKRGDKKEQKGEDDEEND